VLALQQALVEQGAIDAPLASHRVRDRGMVQYGPEQVESLANRHDIFAWLDSEQPRTVLLRDIDVAPTYQHRRLKGVPMYVLDDSHARLRLVSNALPEGMVDRNRIPEVLFTEPPQLEHETLVRFEQFVEVVGWQVDEPVVRGRKHTLQLVLKVLRPMPGGAKVFARLLGGKLSRINPDPQPLAEDLYPCNLWRPGDYILHRYTFEVPLLEIVPGMHDFVIGLRRGETKNFEISVPEGADGEYGVRIDDRKRAFAKLGTVQVY
jgi:PAS domain-containing protein